MGFGLLLIGYLNFYLLSLNPYGYFFLFPSLCLMVWGLFRLKRYEPNFMYAIYVSILLAFPSVYFFISKLSELAQWNLAVINPTWDNIMDLWLFISSLLLHASFTFAIYSISKKLELDKIVRSSISSACFYGMYSLIYLVSMFLNEESKKVLSLPLLLFNLISLVMYIVLIFRCYIRICDEKDADMNPYKHKIGFFNKVDAVLNKPADKIEESIKKDYEKHHIIKEDKKKK